MSNSSHKFFFFLCGDLRFWLMQIAIAEFSQGDIPLTQESNDCHPTLSIENIGPNRLANIH
ncbi:hypothetical protein [Adonisia turfae]|uniref:hypothetical protein n=1 Tax=Adonisia turfae TaxID=2950184 RepID=UPI0013D5FCD6|nr:hypothetical protein [Adonisia turfae]